MKASQSVRLLPLAVLSMALWFASPTTAAYNSAFCKGKTSWGKGKNADLKPFFYDDFSAINEGTFFKVENVSEAMVTHQQIYFSKSNKQVVLYEERPDDTFWVFADQDSNDCIYKKGTDQCVAEEGDCKETAKTVGFGQNSGGDIVLGSASDKMGYPNPEDVKKKVSFGAGLARKIITTRLGICSYRADTDETVVTYLQILDPSAYLKMDQTQRIVLNAAIHTKKPGEDVVFQRRDFADYNKLLPSQLTNGFRLGESQCGTIKSKFTSKKLPQPTARFGYVNQKFSTGATDLVRAKWSFSSIHEFNVNSQLSMEIHEVADDSQSEKNTIWHVEDYRGEISYEYSLTKGECNVKSLLTGGGGHQLSSMQFWDFNSRDPTYLGVYMNRDIPCDVWDFATNSDGVTTRLYTATSDWLVSQGYPEDSFFPVQRIAKADKSAVYDEVYGFRNNPGYHIPYLLACFQQDDVLDGEVTVMLNYNRDIVGRAEHFEYEFRTLLMRISGIKSPVRIGAIMPTQSPTSDRETLVNFQIFGKFVGFNDPEDSMYKLDPVTSQKAAERINRQVDAGNMKLTLGDEKLTVSFKKGSFAVAESGKRLRYMDSMNAPSVYSGGAMAGVAIAVLLVSLMLAAAAVFAYYKRRVEGGTSGPSVGMNNLSSDA